MEISNFQSLLGFFLVVLFVLIALPKKKRNNVTKNFKSLFPMNGIGKTITKWIKYKYKNTRRNID